MAHLMFCVLHKKGVDPSHPRTFQLVLWIRSMEVNVWFSGWCVGSVKRHVHRFLLTKFRLLVTQKSAARPVDCCVMSLIEGGGVRNKRARKNRGGRRIDAAELQCGKSGIQSVRISVPCFFCVTEPHDRSKSLQDCSHRTGSCASQWPSQWSLYRSWRVDRMRQRQKETEWYKTEISAFLLDQENTASAWLSNHENIQGP